MNTVNMPGFTAEASLYQASERYEMVETLLARVHRGLGTLVPGATRGEVVPQLQLCEIIYCIGSRCVYDCKEAPV